MKWHIHQILFLTDICLYSENFDSVFWQGKVEVTSSRGKVVWKDGELKVEPGYGRYINMPPFSYLFDGIDKVDAAYVTSLRAPVQRSVST